MAPSCEQADPALWPQDCPTCRDSRWPFEEVVALSVYEGLLRQLILEGKHLAGAHSMRTLGRWLAHVRQSRLGHFVEEQALVVPVPSPWQRRLVRRTNSAEQVAIGLAEGLGLSVHQVLRRARSTRHQTDIAPSEREANVRGAFRAEVPQRFKGRSVLLVDDVLTTGATARAATHALLRGGTGRVVVVVAARRLATL